MKFTDIDRLFIHENPSVVIKHPISNYIWIVGTYFGSIIFLDARTGEYNPLLVTTDRDIAVSGLAILSSQSVLFVQYRDSFIQSYKIIGSNIDSSLIPLDDGQSYDSSTFASILSINDSIILPFEDRLVSFGRPIDFIHYEGIPIQFSRDSNGEYLLLSEKHLVCNITSFSDFNNADPTCFVKLGDYILIGTSDGIILLDNQLIYVDKIELISPFIVNMIQIENQVFILTKDRILVTLKLTDDNFSVEAEERLSDSIEAITSVDSTLLLLDECYIEFRPVQSL